MSIINRQNNKKQHHVSNASFLADALRETFPSYKDTILSCSQCLPPKNKFVIHYKSRIFGDFNEFYNLECTVCRSFWFICQSCDGQRSRYHTVQEAQRHIRLRHKEARNAYSAEIDELPASLDVDNEAFVLYRR